MFPLLLAALGCTPEEPAPSIIGSLDDVFVEEGSYAGFDIVKCEGPEDVWEVIGTGTARADVGDIVLDVAGHIASTTAYATSTTSCATEEQAAWVATRDYDDVDVLLFAIGSELARADAYGVAQVSILGLAVRGAD